MWSQISIIEPGDLQMIQGVAKRKGQELFTGYAKDVSEFLIFLIDCFTILYQDQ